MKNKILKTLSMFVVGLSLFSIKANALLQLNYGSYSNIKNINVSYPIKYNPTTLYAENYQWYICNGKWACATEDLRQSVGNCWVYTNDRWYYIGLDGYMLTDTLITVINYDNNKYLSDTYYYLGSDGAMLTNTSVEITGKYYNVDNNGICKISY
ncbi:hypothetical protein [Clostridium butyricum]|uniref:hypothetical protein n=1 Tax=Clostridium butyricum TaxID=1492 RepID=UPI0006E72184|nr:hypothetical protein AK964_21240 [Clostridium butyricum]